MQKKIVGIKPKSSGTACRYTQKSKVILCKAFFCISAIKFGMDKNKDKTIVTKRYLAFFLYSSFFENILSRKKTPRINNRTMAVGG